MTKRQVEIFIAECPLCNETVQLVQALTCPICEVSLYDLRESESREKAQQYGVNAVPAIAINGTLVLTGIPSRKQLIAVGVGQPL